MRSLVRIAVLGLAFIAFAACSKKAAPRTHEVEIRAMQFVPAQLTIAVGDTVVWTNYDVVPHTATAAGVFDSQSLANNQKWQYTATKAGEVPYVCTFHPTMTGTLTVR